MVDSHCHLADGAFVDDLDAVIDRATGAGLTEALCILDALEPEEGRRGDLARDRWDKVRLAVGVHPHRAGVFTEAPQAAADLVREALRPERGVRALGEIGLDYHYDLAPRAVQREVFAAQVALAVERGVPIVVHTREADDDTLGVIRSAGAHRVTGVFHCFSGDVTLARHALDLGFMISFSGIVTFPKAAEVHDAARFVPDDRLLMETDCPYLAPVPVRGKRNEPAWVSHVAERLATLRGTTTDAVCARTDANYQQLFRP